MLSPRDTPSIENDESNADLECDLFLSQRTTLDTIDIALPGDSDDDIVFDQYLLSPSPSPSRIPAPSPNDYASELSGAALIQSGCDQPLGSLESYTESLKILTPEIPPEGEMGRGLDSPGEYPRGIGP